MGGMEDGGSGASRGRHFFVETDARESDAREKT